MRRPRCSARCSGSSPRSRLGWLLAQGHAAHQPAGLLHGDRRVPRRRRGGRPRVRDPRPAGGRRASRPVHRGRADRSRHRRRRRRLRRLPVRLGVRRERHHRAGQSARRDPAVDRRLHAADVVAPGHRMDRSTSRSSATLFVRGVSARARRARRRRGTAPSRQARSPTPRHPPSPHMRMPGIRRRPIPSKEKHDLVPPTRSPRRRRRRGTRARGLRRQERCRRGRRAHRDLDRLRLRGVGRRRRPAARWRSTSATRATRSRSSTCSPRTACGSSARSRTSRRAPRAPSRSSRSPASTSPSASPA